MNGLLTLVFRRRWAIVWFFFAVVTVVGLATFLSAPTYEVRASILLKKNQAEVPLTPTESNQLVITRLSQEDLNSELAILRSRELTETVSTELGGKRPSSLDDPSPVGRVMDWLDGTDGLTSHQRLVVHLEQKLRFVAVDRSNIVEIRYRSTNPEWARDVVDTLTTAYLGRRLQIHETPGATAFFADEARSARTRLEESEGAVEDYIQTAGLSLPVTSHKEALLQTLAQLEQDLAEAEVNVRESEDRVHALEARWREVPTRLPSAHRDNLAPEVEEIQRGLVALKLRYDAVSRDYSPTNSRVTSLADQVQLAEERLREAEQRAGVINRTELNEVNQTLRAQLLSSQAELEGARARYQSLRVHAARGRRHLDEVNQKTFELERLSRDVSTHEEAYVLYVNKREEARISTAMDRQQMVNASIAQKAQLPLKPVAPRKVINMLVGLFLGAVGALGLAVVRDHFDETLSTPADAEQHLAAPHLGSIPEAR